MPVLENYYQSHQTENFVIVAIESGDSASQVQDFVTSNGLKFPVWLDSKTAALNAFQNWDLPSSYVIDQNGTIRLEWTGAISQGMLDKYVSPLLRR